MEQVRDIPVEKLVPHRRPMILIDVMVEADATRSVCETTIRPDSVFLEPEGVPAFVGIEFMAQAVAAHGGYLSYLKGEPAKVGFLLGTPHLTMARPFFKLGQTLRMEVVEDWGDDQLMRFSCTIRDKDSGAVLQEAGLNVFQPRDLHEYLEQKRGLSP